MASINPINTGASLGKKRAAHLLRRATFGPSADDIDTFAGYTIDQALNVLFELKDPPPPPKDPATGEAWNNPAPTDANSDENDLKDFVMAWWANLQRTSDNSAIERIAWFYHTHFTTIASRVRKSTALYYQTELFRYYALGSIKELSKKLCYDNAMLFHLDGRLNEKGKPNENFAREFLELYTIGKGDQVGPDDYSTFTEEDVRESARVLSGYNVDNTFTNIDEETGVAMGVIRGGSEIAYRHDEGEKVFSAAFQNTVIKPNELVDGKATFDAVLDELDQYVNMIFNQEATARYLCRRLYRFFVYYEITEEVENDIIAPIAQTLIDNEYNMQRVLEQLFKSQHFYDEDNGINTDDNIGALIKSPLDLTLGGMRFFKINMPDENSDSENFYTAWRKILNNVISNQGMDFYEPFEVAGYSAYHQEPGYNRNWISANNLARRYQLSSELIMGQTNDNDELLFKLYIYQYVTDQGIDLNDEQAIVQHFVDYMLPRAITSARFDYFVQALLNGEEAWSTVAENPDIEIMTTHLEVLITAMIQSPEYQLF